MAEPNELEQLQRLSETYHPDLPGPLIGSRLPMLDLVTEYSQADPTFVLKTQSLAAVHSGYRQIKGDGQCGWRGAVFGYFETLLGTESLDAVEQEEIRLRSFAELMKMAGIDYDIIVDMFDYTWDLFADLTAAVKRGEQDEKVLMQYLNDENISNSIVYHFKMMTSAYMQLYPENYENFIPDMSIADYRVSRIDPSNQEIDQIGLQAMTDAVIAPAGIALDVFYLDRSVGDVVTPYAFAPKNVDAPTIRMLYRPGHYDLIYKGSRQVQVFLQNSTAIATDTRDAEQSAFPTEFQAYLLPTAPSALAFPRSNDANFHEAASPHQQQRPFFPLEDSGCTAPQPVLSPVPHPSLDYDQLQAARASVTASSPSPRSSPLNPPTPIGLQPLLMNPAAALLLPSLNEARSGRGPRIRPTKYIMEYYRAAESVPLPGSTTAPGASSSTAHFRNEGFQPQIWRAEDDYQR